jgi:hypothetical protein
VIAYRGDNIAGEPANLPIDVSDRSTAAIARFAACTAGCGRCGEACPVDRLADALPGAQLGWLARRYPVGMQRSADGLLQLADGCATATTSGANASIIDCASAPAWHLADDGTLGTGASLCLDAILTGEIVAGPCSGAGPGGRYFLDEDGHLWSGVVPAPQADMAYAHLDCVLSSGGRPRAALCGQPRAPTVAFTAAAATRSIHQEP